MKIGMIAPVYTRIDIATHRARFIDPFLIGNIEADRLRPKRRLDTARNHPHKTSALLAQKANTDRNSVGSERKYSWIEGQIRNRILRSSIARANGHIPVRQ